MRVLRCDDGDLLQRCEEVLMKRKKRAGGGPLLDASASRSYSNASTRDTRV